MLQFCYLHHMILYPYCTSCPLHFIELSRYMIIADRQQRGINSPKRSAYRPYFLGEGLLLLDEGPLDEIC